ncbi:MAG: sulfotransferase family protein, partial [Nannocystaceae bacterium]
RPIFILGLPRTGTTLLHNLMALAPRGRAPLMWELLRPSPAPRFETRLNDPRIRRTKREVDGAMRLLPSMRAIHPLVPTGPDECFYLFNNSFMSPVAEAQASVPGYMQWLMQTDMTPAYRYYRTQLQLLQRHIETDYWILKTPTHLFALDALLAVFPDARIIQTHRAPRKIVASCCSLYETSRTLFTETVNPKRLGHRWLETWGAAVDHAMDVRAKAGEATFHDLYYEDFVSDPVRAVRSLHEALELDFDDAFVERMRRHLDDSPKKKFGTHHYSLARYGLTDEQVAGRFAGYIDRFPRSTHEKHSS